jgi:hypothetical protein
LPASGTATAPPLRGLLSPQLFELCFRTLPQIWAQAQIQGPLEIGDGFLWLSKLCVQMTADVIRPCIGWIKLKHFLDIGQSLVQVAFVVVGEPAVEVG